MQKSFLKGRAFGAAVIAFAGVASGVAQIDHSGCRAVTKYVDPAYTP
ncbi:hypothetical protein [Hyphomicrobium sp. ghe19]